MRADSDDRTARKTQSESASIQVHTMQERHHQARTYWTGGAIRSGQNPLPGTVSGEIPTPT